MIENSPFVPLNGLFCIMNGIFRLNGTFYATSPCARTFQPRFLSRECLESRILTLRANCLPPSCPSGPSFNPPLKKLPTRQKLSATTTTTTTAATLKNATAKAQRAPVISAANAGCRTPKRFRQLGRIEWLSNSAFFLIV